MDLILDMSWPVIPGKLLHEAFWSQAVLILGYTTLVCTLAYARHVALGLHCIASLGIHVFAAVLPFVLEIIHSSRRAQFFFIF
jgi:hypothetical protein